MVHVAKFIHKQICIPNISDLGMYCTTTSDWPHAFCTHSVL